MQVFGEKEQWRDIEGEMPLHQKLIDSRPKIEDIKPSLECHLIKKIKNMEYGLG